MYNEMAEYYDGIYSFKDYKQEAQKVDRLIRRYKKTKGKELLDVACGTGQHLAHLRKKYEVQGLEKSRGIQRVAQKKLKGIKIHSGDMVTFNLHREFDVVTCLFSSIGYVKTLSNLKKTIRNFSRHLKTGGVLIVEPWVSPKTVRPGNRSVQTYKKEGLAVARLMASEVRGKKSLLMVDWLIGKAGKKTKHYHESHELGLFSEKDTLQIMKEAGFNAFQSKEYLMGRGRTLYVAVKK